MTNADRQRAMRRLLCAFRLSLNSTSQIIGRNHSTLEYYLRDGQPYPETAFQRDMHRLKGWTSAALAEETSALLAALQTL